jgi:tRNA modification GTPase
MPNLAQPATGLFYLPAEVLQSTACTPTSGTVTHLTDTIAAVATPPGRGGIAIVRVSGSRSAEVARALLGCLPIARRATLGRFRDRDGGLIDEGLALFFPAPRSFTGEDVLELHGHGGPVVVDLLLRRVLDLGARLARPGEFTERAFLNDRLDLAQAEAVADLIDAGTEQAARAAVCSLEGHFSERIRALVDNLIQLRVYVEAALDFPEEHIDFLSDRKIAEDLQCIRDDLQALSASARQGALLREGMNVVIAGRPNAGKSSLLNKLAGYEAAIVTEVPGTTRDVLREHIQIDGMPLHAIDTAGLREAGDRVEREGIRRAWDEIARADRILLVLDDRAGITAEEQAILARLPQGPGLTIVRNKIDLTDAPAGSSETDLGPAIALSAKTGAGLETLREHLKECMGYRAEGEGRFIARRRHLDALRRTADFLQDAAEHLTHNLAGELVAEALRQAQNTLCEITGEFTSEDLLDRIFSSFCIGK